MKARSASQKPQSLVPPYPSSQNQSEPNLQGPDTGFLLQIDHWSDLAIGIDEKGQYWAITPPPEQGELFKKAHAIELPLKGDRWRKVLETLAESESGHRVRRADLLQSLGYFSPSVMLVDRDSRALPGEIEHAQIQALETRFNVARKQLTMTLADLRRELGNLVRTGKNSSLKCLRADGDFMDAGFRVRYLTRGSNERLVFGTSKA